MHSSVKPNFAQIGLKMWEVPTQVQCSMAFPKTHIVSINFCGHPLYRILSTSEGNVDNRATLRVGLNAKHAFHCTDFHKAQNSSTALRGNSLYRISPNSITKYGKWGYKFIYALKHESVCRC